MPKEEVHRATGGKKEFVVESNPGFWRSDFEVRDADTGKLVSWSTDRATATQKADDLADKN